VPLISRAGLSAASAGAACRACEHTSARSYARVRRARLDGAPARFKS